MNTQKILPACYQFFFNIVEFSIKVFIRAVFEMNKFTGELETLVLQESQQLGIRIDTEVFSDGKNLLKSIQSGDHYELIFIVE